MDENESRVYPTFGYEDAPAAIDWLEKAFGFNAGMVVHGEERPVEHAELQFEDSGAWIMLGSLAEGTPDNPWPALRQGIYLYVPDVDVHYERARAAGAEIVREISDTEYGAREYSARDLEGNLWSFGNYRPQRPV
ncbi:MAG TPA: VOC family protein [Dehalococcoidia bacterium]|nr:VOC family protein [Dehalococcoidia bacterium]